MFQRIWEKAFTCPVCGGLLDWCPMKHRVCFTCGFQSEKCDYPRTLLDFVVMFNHNILFHYMEWYKFKKILRRKPDFVEL